MYYVSCSKGSIICIHQFYYQRIAIIPLHKFLHYVGCLYSSMDLSFKSAFKFSQPTFTPTKSLTLLKQSLPIRNWNSQLESLICASAKSLVFHWTTSCKHHFGPHLSPLGLRFSVLPILLCGTAD